MFFFQALYSAFDPCASQTVGENTLISSTDQFLKFLMSCLSGDLVFLRNAHDDSSRQGLKPDAVITYRFRVIIRLEEKHLLSDFPEAIKELSSKLRGTFLSQGHSFWFVVKDVHCWIQQPEF